MKLQNKIVLLSFFACKFAFSQENHVNTPTPSRLEMLSNRVWDLSKDFEIDSKRDEMFDIHSDSLMSNNLNLILDSNFLQNLLLKTELGMDFVGRLEVRCRKFSDASGFELEIFNLKFFNEQNLFATKTVVVATVDNIYTEKQYDYKNAQENKKLELLALCKFAVNKNRDGSIGIQTTSSKYVAILFDEIGSKIKEFSSKESNFIIQLNDLKTGVYTVQLTDVLSNKSCSERIFIP